MEGATSPSPLNRKCGGGPTHVTHALLLQQCKFSSPQLNQFWFDFNSRHGHGWDALPYSRRRPAAPPSFVQALPSCRDPLQPRTKPAATSTSTVDFPRGEDPQTYSIDHEGDRGDTATAHPFTNGSNEVAEEVPRAGKEVHVRPKPGSHGLVRPSLSVAMLKCHGNPTLVPLKRNRPLVGSVGFAHLLHIYWSCLIMNAAIQLQFLFFVLGILCLFGSSRPI